MALTCVVYKTSLNSLISSKSENYLVLGYNDVHIHCIIYADDNFKFIQEQVNIEVSSEYSH